MTSKIVRSIIRRCNMITDNVSNAKYLDFFLVIRYEWLHMSVHHIISLSYNAITFLNCEFHFGETEREYLSSFLTCEVLSDHICKESFQQQIRLGWSTTFERKRKRIHFLFWVKYSFTFLPICFILFRTRVQFRVSIYPIAWVILAFYSLHLQ